MSMLFICPILPLDSDMWQMVSELHAMNFLHRNHDTKSIQWRYSKLVHEQPDMGKPSMSQPTLLAKAIKEAINIKAGVANLDLTGFFAKDSLPVADDVEEVEEDEDADASPILESVKVVLQAWQDSEPSILRSVAGKKATKKRQWTSSGVCSGGRRLEREEGKRRREGRKIVGVEKMSCMSNYLGIAISKNKLIG
jgi:hypothetical protein